MMRIAVCDIEANARVQLTKILNEISFQYQIDFKIDCFECGEDLLRKLSQSSGVYDLIFTEVLLGTLNGIQIAKVIRETNQEVSIVFLASTARFALQGYDLKISNYLLKPLEAEKIKSCVLDHYKRKCSASVMFTFHTHHTLHTVPMGDINYFEVYKRIVYLHTINHKEIEENGFYKKLDDLAQELVPYDFIRCHRSYLINLKNVAAITQEEVIFNDKQRVPISKRQYKEIRGAFLNYAAVVI